MATTISNRVRPGKIIEDIEAIKKIALKLLSTHNEITAGTIWSAGRVSYSNAQKAINELEAEGHICQFTQSDTDGPVTFWKKTGGAT